MTVGALCKRAVSGDSINLLYDTETSPNLWATQQKKEWRQTVFTYNEDGISIRIPNVYAWVCPEDGEASFTPETADELIVALREFVDAAKRAKERRSVLTEYVVAVE